MKVTIVGAGNVGSTTAQILAQKEIVKEIVLLDIKDGMSEGKSLDLWQSSSIEYFDTKIHGYTNEYNKTVNSKVVVITSGVARKPNMLREDLITINATIVKTVTEKIVQYSPGCIIIVVSNPLDLMTYLVYRVSGFSSNRVLGMAGILDTARYKSYLADELNCSPKDIQALILGSHNDKMVILPRYTTVAGIPVNQLISEEKLAKIVKRTKTGGAEIVGLLGTSAWYAPAAAIAQMVEAIINDQKRIFSCCTVLNGEYGLKDICIGVPVKIGKNGVEKVVEIELNNEERRLFELAVLSVKHLKNLLIEMQLLE